MNAWMFGRLGVAFVLGCAAAVVNAEARFSFETTPGRLIKAAVPSHYDLKLEIAADSKSFNGIVDIALEVLQPTPKLELNALDLALQRASLRADAANNTSTSRTLAIAADDAREIATFTPQDKNTIAPGRYVLSIAYQGKIQERVGGLFRVNYKRTQQRRVVDDFVLASHGEPSYMRRLFPGWDEPVYRAAYTLSVVTDDKLKAISNMPIAQEKPQGTGRKLTQFEKSVSMPSYLLSLYIGPWDVLEDTYNGKPIRIYTTPGRAQEGTYALEVTKQVLKEFEEYFGQPYTLPKLDQIAVPGGMGGAMENWGAIYYNENALLYTAERGVAAQRRIYNIVAHEIAHQWFGNLVTMAWWDNLWLNEGFASWMASRTTAKFNPRWDVPLAGARWRQEAMEDDAMKTTHAIQTPVEHEARAFEVFDSITYSKGEAFISMLEAFVGPEQFRTGIRNYMAQHKMSNTTTADLWHHLSQAAAGKEVASFASAWTLQPGLPKIHVAQSCSGGQSTVTLKQERFTLNDARALALFWQVPVSLSNDANRKPVTALVPRDGAIVTLPGCAPVMADPLDNGYFRVRYDDALAAKHAARMAQLPSSVQIKLLNDTFALAQNGAYGFERYFELLDKLPVSAHPAIWQQATEHLGTLHETLAGSDAQRSLNKRIITWLSPIMQKAGWQERAEEDAAMPSLRVELIIALARAGDAATHKEAMAQFARWQKDAASVPASLKGAMLRAAAMQADGDTWQAMAKHLRSTASFEERLQLMRALTSVQNADLAARSLQLLADAMQEGTLMSGDALWGLRSLGKNSGHAQQAWTFMQERWAQLTERAGRYGAHALAPEAMSAFNTEAQAQALLAWQKEKLGANAMYPAEKAAEWIRLKASMQPRVVKALAG